MEFNETQAGILVNAWLLARAGCGLAVEPWAYADAAELEEAGWLERRSEPEGPSSWWWTPAAESALDLIALKESVKGREN